LISGKPGQRYFEDELEANVKHTKRPRKGLVMMANRGPNMNTSGFFITLTDQALPDLYKRHTVFGVVAEGLEVLDKINNAYCDGKGRPYQNIRIKHTLIIEDPFEDIPGMRVPSRSPSPIVIRKKKNLLSGQLEEDPDDYPDYLEDDLDLKTMMEGKTEKDLEEEAKEH
jgi:peptidyl-prolyl cis-trans isomerase-like 4